MRTVLTVLVSTLLLFPVPVTAQSAGLFEFGTDIGLSVLIPEFGENVTSIDVPVSRLRIAYHASDNFALEPRASFGYVSSGGESASSLGLSTAALVSIADNFYFFGVGGLQKSTDVDVRWLFGGGAGIRTSIDDRLGLRWEAGLAYLPENDDFQQVTAVQFSVGLSFFSAGN